jgi:hypothetical protein
MRQIIFAFLLGLACCGISSAQVNSTFTIDFSNPAIMSLEIDRSSISVQLPTNYNPGPVSLSKPVMVTIKSNMPWTLTVTSTTDFLGVDNPANSISCDQLEFRSRLSGSTESVREQQEEYLAFSKGHSMTIARGDATPNDGLHIMIEYRLRINLKDPAGNYSLPIVFTLNPSQ